MFLSLIKKSVLQVFSILMVIGICFLSTASYAQLQASEQEQLNEEFSLPSELNTQFVGNEGAHGGNDVALDFKKAAQRAIRFASNSDPSSDNILRCYNLQLILSQAKVFVTKQKLFVGTQTMQQRAVAVTVPSDNITYLNEDDWAAIKDDKSREAIAFHEVLIHAGLEETSVYTFSQNYALSKTCSNMDCLEPVHYYCSLNKSSFENSKPEKINLKRIDSGNIIGINRFVFDSESIGHDMNIEVVLYDTGAIKGLDFNAFDSSGKISKLSMSEMVEFPKSIKHGWLQPSQSLKWELQCSKLKF